MVLRQAENTSFLWLTVEDALSLYMKGELPLFPPQVIMLTRLKFLNCTYNKLRAYLRQSQLKPDSYLTNRGTMILFSQLAEQEGKKSEKALMK